MGGLHKGYSTEWVSPWYHVYFSSQPLAFPFYNWNKTSRTESEALCRRPRTLLHSLQKCCCPPFWQKESKLKWRFRRGNHLDIQNIYKKGYYEQFQRSKTIISKKWSKLLSPFTSICFLFHHLRHLHWLLQFPLLMRPNQDHYQCQWHHPQFRWSQHRGAWHPHSGMGVVWLSCCFSEHLPLHLLSFLL